MRRPVVFGGLGICPIHRQTHRGIGAFPVGPWHAFDRQSVDAELYPAQLARRLTFVRRAQRQGLGQPEPALVNAGREQCLLHRGAAFGAQPIVEVGVAIGVSQAVDSQSLTPAGALARSLRHAPFPLPPFANRRCSSGRKFATTPPSTGHRGRAGLAPRFGHRPMPSTRRPARAQICSSNPLLEINPLTLSLPEDPLQHLALLRRWLDRSGHRGRPPAAGRLRRVSEQPAATAADGWHLSGRCHFDGGRSPHLVLDHFLLFDSSQQRRERRSILRQFGRIRAVGPPTIEGAEVAGDDRRRLFTARQIFARPPLVESCERELRIVCGNEAGEPGHILLLARQAPLAGTRFSPRRGSIR